MKTRPLYLACLILLALLQCATGDAPPKIKKMDAAKKQSLRTALQNDTARGGEPLRSWFVSVCICAPRLWAAISVSLDKKGIEVIPTHFGKLDGATFKGADANRRLANAVAPLLTAGKVRLLTEDELTQYWRIFPFEEIEEPVFVVSSGRADILMHLQWDTAKNRYFVFLIEALRLQEK
jgi:hypothetical protein